MSGLVLQKSCPHAGLNIALLPDVECNIALLQVSAIKVLLGDLRGGLNKVNTEILKAAGVDANSAFAHRQFGDLMMAFHQHGKSTFADIEASRQLHDHIWTKSRMDFPLRLSHRCS